MIKRLIGILLTVCLMITVVPTMAFAKALEEEEPKKVTLSMYSNKLQENSISGLYEDNVFYIPLDKLCGLVEGTIKNQTDKAATISVGCREFLIDVGSENMAEKLYSGDYNVTMPSMFVDNQIYISALHFLKYIGATVHIDEQSSIQFMVIKRYDIFDALEDMNNSNNGNYFWWDEFDIEYDDLEDKIINAGIVALINRDSNVFRMIFDAKGMEQEAVEEALLTIVKNEGAKYFDESSKVSEEINLKSEAIGTVADWIGLVSEAYKDIPGLDEQIEKIVKTVDDRAGDMAFVAEISNRIVQAIETLKQFDNMSATQKDLLANTILEHSADSEMLNDQLGVVYDATQNINKKIQSEFARYLDVATQELESTAYDLVYEAIEVPGKNPVLIAWDSAILLTRSIPSTKEIISRKDKLYNAYNSAMIQLIANEMLMESFSDWYYGKYNNLEEQYDILNSVKQLMILRLKSTLTTREYLIQSGFLDENYAIQMQEMNIETAELLNKTINCKITGVNMFSTEYGDDLSWMMKNTVSINEKDWENLLSQGSIFAEYVSRDITLDTLCRYYIYHGYKLPVERVESVDVDPLNDITPYVTYGSIAKIPIESLQWIAETIFQTYEIDYTQSESAKNAYDIGVGSAYYPYEGYYYYYEVGYAGWEDCIGYNIDNYDILDDGKIYVEVQVVTPYEIYPVYILCKLEESENKKYWIYESIGKEPLKLEFSGQNVSNEPAYKKAYADFIMANCSYRDVFDFIYLDGDETPELIISPAEPNHADGLYIYSYHGGQVMKVGGIGGSFGEFMYVEKGNYIISNYYGSGMNTYYMYQIIDHSLTCTFWTEEYQIGDKKEYSARVNEGDVVDITKEQYEQYVQDMLSPDLKTYKPNPENSPTLPIIYNDLKHFSNG